MSKLSHPNIVTYYGIEVHRDKVYLFMEYCEAGSLLSLLRTMDKLGEKLVQWYVLQILRGLSYLHSKNIVHRDIKPDSKLSLLNYLQSTTALTLLNTHCYCIDILLDHNDIIKLVDFGAAKTLNMHSVVLSRHSKNSKHGKQNTLTGTPAYMAPETIRNDPHDQPTLGSQDIWALGCCIVELITGEPPWSKLDNEWAIMYRVANDNPLLPESSELSELGIDFLQKCFVRPASSRPSANELLDHLWLSDVKNNMEELKCKLNNPRSSGTGDYSGNMPSWDRPDTPIFHRTFDPGYPFPQGSASRNQSNSYRSVEENEPSTTSALLHSPRALVSGMALKPTLANSKSHGSGEGCSHEAGTAHSNIESSHPYRMVSYMPQIPSNTANSALTSLNGDTGTQCNTHKYEGSVRLLASLGPGGTKGHETFDSSSKALPGALQSSTAPNLKDLDLTDPAYIDVIESLISMFPRDANAPEQKQSTIPPIGTTLSTIIYDTFVKGLTHFNLKGIPAQAEQRIPEDLAEYIEEQADIIVSLYLTIPMESTYGSETDLLGKKGLMTDILVEGEVDAARDLVRQRFEQQYWQYRHYQKLLQQYQQRIQLGDQHCPFQPNKGGGG